MNLEFFEQVISQIKEKMDPERYMHTIGVAYTSAALAMNYHYDNVDRAMIAGLLHDIAKCIPNEEKVQICMDNEIILSEAEIENPSLIHAKLGALVAQQDFWIYDVEILDAIRSHTTGEPNMKMLQKIVFVADYIEPNRTDIIPNIDRIQEMAFNDLDLCVLTILGNTLEYLKTKGRTIDPRTQISYEFYKELIDNRDKNKEAK